LQQLRKEQAAKNEGPAVAGRGPSILPTDPRASERNVGFSRDELGGRERLSSLSGLSRGRFPFLQASGPVFAQPGSRGTNLSRGRWRVLPQNHNNSLSSCSIFAYAAWRRKVCTSRLNFRILMQSPVTSTISSSASNSGAKPRGRSHKRAFHSSRRASVSRGPPLRLPRSWPGSQAG
jgi:hypothetical protein